MLQFSHLHENCNISHFITTRKGGVSQGEYASLNLGFNSGDDRPVVEQNREILCNAVSFSPDHLYVPFQVHGNKSVIIDEDFLSQTTAEQTDILYGVDALITCMPGLCIAVSTADCVPVLLYAPDKKVVAAIHAGWRGTVQNITATTVQTLVNHFGCDPSRILAGIGPSICKDCFEVGEEVIEAFQEITDDIRAISHRHIQTGKPHVDLWQANRLQLLEAGLSDVSIEIAGICTYTSTDFFSARRQGVPSGRMLSGVMINKI